MSCEAHALDARAPSSFPSDQMAENSMSCWNWEFFESEITPNLYRVTDYGPLFGPVTGFKISRDKSLNIVLETTSAGNSISNAIERPAGSVYRSTDEIKLGSQFGSNVIASGVIPRQYTRNLINIAELGETKQTSTIHSLKWRSESDQAPQYLIEWLENIPDRLIWPHADDVSAKGENRRRLHSPLGEVIISTPIDSMSGSRSCVHLFIDGIELFIGTSKVKNNHIAAPGFILYRGSPNEATRAKIRDCLSFCLGSFLLYLGNTTFDSEWHPIAFDAKSGHALVEDAPRLNHWQPAPLGSQWEFQVTHEFLERMATSLYRIYDTHNLRSIFWSYWHALAAPVHMAAAHFGSAIEAAQKAFFNATDSKNHRKIINDEQAWAALLSKISTCISDTALPDSMKATLCNKAKTLNSAPQSLVMERFSDALGLKIGTLEMAAWANRNRAAHGGSADEESAPRIIRENKVLLIMLNRILLAMGNGADFYYDYYNLGRPTVQLADPITDDRCRKSA